MWKKQFNETLHLLGHRNWILVVDKAYPLQSANGIEYINTCEEHGDVLKYVLDQVEAASHIKAAIYTDKEFDYLSALGEKEAQMVEAMKVAFEGYEVQSILHDEIFTKLDTASKLFNVLVIKTESTVAYSSVFLELDCGYWTAEKEQALRDSMK
ncbi:MAG: RbsD/FucU domain-containing protein [Rikenellaceae bacterium]